MTLPMISLWKDTSATPPPFWKGRGGIGPAMPAFSGVPVHIILAQKAKRETNDAS